VQKKKRVLIDPRANTPAYDVALLAGLRRQGEDAELFTADFYPDPYAPASKVPGRRYYFLRLSRFLRRKFKHVKPVVKVAILLGPIEYVADLLRLAFYCLLKRPTLHIVWAFVLPADLLFLLFVRLIGLQVVYTVHNPLPHDKETRTNKLLYGLLYGLTNELIFHCQATVDDCKAVIPLEGRKWSIIPCGVFFADWEPVRREEARKKLGWPQDETIVVFVGHARPYKGLDILLRAIAAMNTEQRVRLVVSASFRFAHMEDFAELFDAVRAKVALDIYDEVPSDERFVHLTCGADLFVLPYRSGTASVSGMTAVRFGTPLIVTNVGALPEMLGEGLAEYVVEPCNVDALRDALERFLALDAAQRKDIGEALEHRGREHFGWDNIARQTIAVYNSHQDPSK
jgi:glycosyltransferase involved in cell wall biosynthesis